MRFGCFSRIRKSAHALCAVLALCLIALPNPADASDAVLHRAIPAEIDTLDPHRATLKWAWDLLRDAHEGLTTADAEGRTVPGAAKDWTVSDDGLRYTFRLREGLRWSGGDPLTAEHYVAGLRRLFDPNTASKAASLVYGIANARAVNAGRMAVETLGVRAPDATTVEIDLDHPMPRLPVLLALPFAAPAPLDPTGSEPWYRAGGPYFSGAYRIRSWTPGDRTGLERNTAYRDAGQVAIARVDYLPARNEAQALRRFRAEEFDIVSWLSGAQIRWVDANLPEASRRDPALFVTYLVFNTRQAPFDNAELRRALSLAVDRSAIAEKVLGIGDRPASGFVPIGVSSYAGPPADKRPFEERRTEAREIMADLGYGPNNPLAVSFRVRASEDDKRAALAVRQMWSEIGVQAEFVTADLRTHYAALESGDFEVADAGWSSFDGPEFFLDLFLSETGGLNYGAYSSSDYDATLKRARSTPELAERHLLFAEAERILLGDAAVAPLHFNVSRYLVAPHVEGFVGNAPDIHLSRYLSIAPSR